MRKGWRKGGRQEGMKEDNINMCVEVCKVEKTSLFLFASLKCTLEVTLELHRETGRFLFLG